MIAYPIATSGQSVVLTDAVVAHFKKHRQNRWLKREAGGQLFARLRIPEIIIEEATGPRSSDRRGRYHYIPDRRAEQAEIEERYESGLHYVGDWHTHPTAVPQPSSLDLGTIQECFIESSHNLAGFILIIVGSSQPPKGLLVSINNAISSTFLLPSPAFSTNAGRSAIPIKSG